MIRKLYALAVSTERPWRWWRNWCELIAVAVISVALPPKPPKSELNAGAVQLRFPAAKADDLRLDEDSIVKANDGNGTGRQISIAEKSEHAQLRPCHHYDSSRAALIGPHFAAPALSAKRPPREE